ncbi:YndM family protein [Priestia abyssalis]|uniref:YndM family protein n=1 Tax=Priestia abyssalis TaxID=1221450 RepID=UPI000995D19B|nr:YndM family protein [Priestia abyssalis]
MKNTTVLLLKFISSVIAFTIALDLFFDATITDILSFSVFVTLASYMLGDRIILPNFGNVPASIVDFLLTYMSVWVFGSILLDNYLQIAWGSIISAILITGAEVFIHLYLLNYLAASQTKERPQIHFNRRLAYGTEFAEEQDIHDKRPPEE